MHINKQVLIALTLVLCTMVKHHALADDISAVSEPAINQFCALVPNGELLANPSSCSGYYQCLNGVAYTKTCATNYFFDKDSQMCLPSNQVYCSANNNYVCTGQAIGAVIPITGNCNSYYICTSTGPQIGYCPSNYNYNPINKQCQVATQYPCTNTNTGDSISGFQPCDYMQNGVAFKDPSTCQNWFICQNNVLSMGTCPTNSSFDVSTARCTYDTSCTSNTNTGDSIPPAFGTICNQQGQTMAVPNSCIYFYKCNGQQYILQQCPNDLYYDTVSGSCVSQLNARNNCDRCVGNNLQFVNEYSTSDCTNYIYCVNGVANYTGTCPSGAYFNQVSGTCQLNVPEPNFGCCNPAIYNTNK